MWYLVNVSATPIDHPDYLCATCRHIDLKWLLSKSKPARTAAPEQYIRLGTLLEMSEQTTCSLCRIVVATVGLRIRLGLEKPSAKLHHDPEQLLRADWYLSPFVYAHKEYPVGYQLFLRHNVFEQARLEDTTHTSPSHPFAWRLVNTLERGGRRVPINTLDFDWISNTMRLCALSTEMPHHVFQRPIRVIDVCNMCLVDMSEVEDYVALSYPWGRVDRLRLNSLNEAELRQENGVANVFHRLARTIQDAIILTQQVGQKRLWVDSLSIIQDDETDVRQQMAQMGEIYKNSYFTIFALSGHDADYGLPGVRQNSRNLVQIFEQILGLNIVNSLPWMKEEDLLNDGSWGSRAWTFQERFRAQRGLFIGEKGMIINCQHIYSPEDEHCWHSLTRNEEMLAKGNWVFYSGMDMRSEHWLKEQTPFDKFAQYVYEYTLRKLTYQSDALPAFLGVLNTLERMLVCKFLHGLPDVEFDASLLWSPLGYHSRRAGYPSWSWLGWVGTVAYPWTIERDTYLSTENSPLEWLDTLAAQRNRHTVLTVDGDSQTAYQVLRENGDTDRAWFTFEDLCLPRTPERRELLGQLLKRYKADSDYLRIWRFCNHARADPEWRANFFPNCPTEPPPLWQYIDWNPNQPMSHRLTFRTLTSHFYVVGRPYQRTKLFNMQHPIWRQVVCDRMGHLAGYIEVPEPRSQGSIPPGSWNFAAMSRSTTDGKFLPPPDPLSPRRLKPIVPELDIYGRTNIAEIEELMNSVGRDENINAKGGFDKTIYDETRPWCMFNVLMLRQDTHIYHRAAIGRIHVDAFLAHKPVKEVIELE
jgi:hypothetical protein